jgi:hypothetical protein
MSIHSEVLMELSTLEETSTASTSLMIQDLEFQQNASASEADELEGQGLLGAGVGAAIGGLGGAAAGFVTYAAGYAYDNVVGSGSSWSWTAAGRDTFVGAAAGAVGGAVAGAFAPL